jgi:SPX domain protein involved in polyphosphate accumulation
MKFGQQLRSSIIREYQWYYIDYDGLKAELKAASGPPISTEEDDNEAGPSNTSNGKKIAAPAKQKNKWTEEDEQKFIAKLYAELDKVYTKTKVKESEIQRRIAVSEREVREVVSKATERGLTEQGPPEEDFILLEGDLSDIIADVHDLAKYVQLNYTGFYKIIKKHDVCAPCLSTKPIRKSELTRITENDVLVPTTILRCRTKEKTVLQRRLRRRSSKTLEFIQQRPDKRQPGEGRQRSWGESG